MNIKKYFTLTFLLFLLLTATLHAQNGGYVVSGIITDQNGSALAEVTVTLIDQTGKEVKKSISNEEGHFSIEVPSTDFYKLTLVKSGFETTTKDISSRSKNLSLILPVEYVGITVEIKDESYIVSNNVTGTKTLTPVLKTPQSVTIITNSLINDRRPTGLSETLFNVSGVSDGGSRRSTADFPIIRGFEAASDVFLDGLRVERGQANVQQEIYAFDKVEIIKGPSSVLFGQGALGGVINAVSKRPPSQRYFNFQGSSGSYGYVEGQVDIGGVVNKVVSSRLVGIFRDKNDFVDHVGSRRIFLAPSTTFQISPKTQVTVLSSLSNDSGDGSYVGLPAEGTILPNPNGNIPRNRNIREPNYDLLEIDRLQIGYSFSHEFNESLTLRQNLRFSRSDVLSNLTISLALAPYDLRTLFRGLGKFTLKDSSLPIDTNFESRFRTGSLRHTFLAGVDHLTQNVKQSFAFGMHSSIDLYNPIYGQPIAQLFPPGQDFERNDRLTGIYLQDQIRINDRLTFVLGTRIDNADSSQLNFTDGSRLSQNSNSFVPRVGLVYQFISQVSTYGNYSQSFNPNFGSAFDGTFFDAERGQIFETGIKTFFANGRFTSTFSGYKISRTNVLTDDPNPMHSGFQVATGKQESRGFEADILTQIKANWILTAAYAFTEAIITEDTFAQGSRPLNVPKNQLNLFTRYGISEGKFAGLSIGGGARYVGDREAVLPNSYSIPAYTVADLHTGYRKGMFKIQLNISNLFNREYFSSAASTGGLGVLVGEPRSYRGTFGVFF